MQRREFISLLGGAALVCPLAARAQQPERVRRIGVLLPATADDSDFQTSVRAFQQELAQLGWTIGRNVRIDTRWTGGNSDDTRKYAIELVALAPDVILAVGSVTVEPLLQATRIVPIVFALVPDPVGAGFVASLARPGGNATGFTNFEYSMSGKWLELLKEIAPRITRVAVLGCHHTLWGQLVKRDPIGSAVIRGGVKPDWHARRRGARASHRSVCTGVGWRPHRYRERANDSSPRADHHACGSASTTRGLF